MANNEYTRNPIKIDASINEGDLKTRFENMLNSVTDMITQDGHIYSVWIYFQIGMDDEHSIKFNSATQNKNQNLIAQLNIEKSCSGIANSFTLTIQYDPFNYGQDTTDGLDMLEEFIAQAMSEDFNDERAYRGKLQYGYNSTTANNLVSPLYEFILTGADTQVKVDTGITTYTFTGTSILSGDCDFTTTFPAIQDENLMEAVGRTLYRWYGDIEHKPENINVNGVIPTDNEYKYRIDIPKELVDTAVTVSYKEVTANTMSPLAYCKDLLNKYPLTEPETQSGKYDDISSMSINQRPRYTISLTDYADVKTIHISHTSPNNYEDENGNKVSYGAGRIGYVFEWGRKNVESDEPIKSIVLDWKPEVDLYTYITRKSQVRRLNRLNALRLNADGTVNREYEENYQALAKSVQSEITDMYNAEMNILGIPADPPMTAEITVIPHVLERESRTQGIYMIQGASDVINTSGQFITTLKLFRIGNTDGKSTVQYEYKTKTSSTNNVEAVTNNDIINATKVEVEGAQDNGYTTEQRITEPYQSVIETGQTRLLNVSDGQQELIEKMQERHPELNLNTKPALSKNTVTSTKSSQSNDYSKSSNSLLDLAVDGAINFLKIKFGL